MLKQTDGDLPTSKEIGDRFGLLKAYESLQMGKVTMCKKSQLFPLLQVDYSTRLTVPVVRICLVLQVKILSCAFKTHKKYSLQDQLTVF